MNVTLSIFIKRHCGQVEYPPAIALYADACKIVVLHIENVILAIFTNRHWRAGRTRNFELQKFINRIRQNLLLRYSAVPCSAVLRFKTKDFQS